MRGEAWGRGEERSSVTMRRATWGLQQKRRREWERDENVRGKRTKKLRDKDERSIVALILDCFTLERALDTTLHPMSDC